MTLPKSEKGFIHIFLLVLILIVVLGAVILINHSKKISTLSQNPQQNVKGTEAQHYIGDDFVFKGISCTPAPDCAAPDHPCSDANMPPGKSPYCPYRADSIIDCSGVYSNRLTWDQVDTQLNALYKKDSFDHPEIPQSLDHGSIEQHAFDRDICASYPGDHRGVPQLCPQTETLPTNNSFFDLIDMDHMLKNLGYNGPYDHYVNELPVFLNIVCNNDFSGLKYTGPIPTVTPTPSPQLQSSSSTIVPEPKPNIGVPLSSQSSIPQESTTPIVPKQSSPSTQIALKSSLPTQIPITPVLSPSPTKNLPIVTVSQTAANSTITFSVPIINIHFSLPFFRF